MKKRITALTLALLLMTMAGCGKQSDNESSQADISIVSSSAESASVAPSSPAESSQPESESSQDSTQESEEADPSSSISEPPTVSNTADSSKQASESAVSTPPAQSSQVEEKVSDRMIQVSDGTHTVTFQLNDSTASKDLYVQLPLSLPVEDYSTNEKIFYPPKALDVTDTPQARGGVGTLAYYSPWADVVLFFGSYSPNGSLYELGQVVSGSDQIKLLEGSITIEAVS